MKAFGTMSKKGVFPFKCDIWKTVILVGQDTGCPILTCFMKHNCNSALEACDKPHPGQAFILDQNMVHWFQRGAGASAAPRNDFSEYYSVT